MNQQRRNSSLLELEAADYFKLDPSQVHLFNRVQSSSQTRLYWQDTDCPINENKHSPTSRSSNDLSKRHTEMHHTKPSHFEAPSDPKTTTAKPKSHKTTRSAHKSNGYATRNTLESPKKRQSFPSKTTSDVTGRNKNASPSRLNNFSNPQLVGSSTSSTNSLPSISSSPSVSPSLICPHLSIDDILKYQNTKSYSKSPHTIGLCAKCRLDPPPNIHSPLSPAFKPSKQHMSRSQTSHSMHQSKRDGGCQTVAPAKTNKQMTRMRRGHSDHQPGAYNRNKSHARSNQVRDDSLDYSIEPKDLRRLQLSPTLRNSVEFIRNNSIESGRVLRVYKNGQPFDKPLRICITRNEFSNLNNLLDHINGRQLIPSGARYLFHMDGQLVYSVHELKHGSSYIVSGTRTFDIKANAILKEQIARELERARPRSHLSASRSLGASEISLNRLEDIDLLVKEKPKSPNVDATVTTTKKAPNPIKTKPKATHRVTGVTKSLRRDQVDAMERQKLSMSSADLSDNGTQDREQGDKEREAPVRIMRAKSELSALPPKRKKMVTFVDTGRGSSPAIPTSVESSSSTATTNTSARGNEFSQPVRDQKGNVSISTNEIGIQVSDSIDGFLIDLPIAIPGGRGSSDRGKPRTRVVTSGPRRVVGGARGTNTASRVGAKPKPKVVTITERQLSLDEINQFKDLDHGDHHSEAHKVQHVTITLEAAEPPTDDEEDGAGHSKQQVSEVGTQKEDGDAEEVIPDRTGTINIGDDPGVETSDQAEATTSGRLEDELSWQYPGGRESSTTPIERPVSQSEANETVHARVTTPTPSLSTAGDSNSLSMSYDAVAMAAASGIAGDDTMSVVVTAAGRRVPVGGEMSARDLPPKERVPVAGILRNGLDIPTRNFSLIWVNGFAVNDQYPDNGSAAAQAAATQLASPASQTGTVLLSPQRNAGTGANSDNSFKLSERFNNWVCHSRKHDELLYPAGSLVVLWCRWTDEQRFYSRHTANVCALTLVSMEADLACSAQIGAGSSLSSASGQVHIWSLTRLDTLKVIQDDHFRGRLIYSLRAKHSTGLGCQLTVAAKDEKRLWLSQFNFKLSLGAPSESGKRVSLDQEMSGKLISKSQVSVGKPSGAAISSATSPISALKESKVLPANQIPLFITLLPLEQRQVPVVQSTSLTNGKTMTTTTTVSKPASHSDLLLSFGRRHFQVWAPDKRQRKLRLLQPELRSSTFGELMVRATCSTRMSPMELLVGDSEGNVALVELDCHSPDAPTSSKSVASSLLARDLDPLASLQKYGITLHPLLGPLTNLANQSDVSPLLAAREPPKAPTFTCLSRVSGSIFATADSSCRIKFWKLERHPKSREGEQQKALGDQTVKLESMRESLCRQISCLTLPPDLGFICSIIISRYDRKQALVEFYVISTSNAILFGSVKLQMDPTATVTPEVLAGSSLSVVYEGHETSAMNLVADRRPAGESDDIHNYYFTCSLDCKICKWDGIRLVWKSMLPSACASLAVHPTGFVLAVGSVDGTVYILDKVSGLLISYFPLTPVRINCLAYTRDGGLMAAGCANGSIFVLPVYERGLKYKKVSIFQSPNPVMSIQFSLNNRHILTSVTRDAYQELILWDLPKFRYMRDGVKLAADKIAWFDSICGGSEDMRATWENANLLHSSYMAASYQPKAANRKAGNSNQEPPPGVVVNACCHRLIRQVDNLEDYAIAGDTRGYLRLFRYPCYDIERGFYETRVSSSTVNCCRFLASSASRPDEVLFVSSTLDGLICLWKLE